MTQLNNITMGLFDLFGIPGAVAPTTSFAELIKSLRGNRDGEMEQYEEDVANEDNQEEQNEGE